jgi:hypothetical protein
MSKKAMKLALEELRYVLDCINKDKIPFDGDDFHETIKALEEALAKQEQGEPVAVWELQESGWETICDGDWLMTLPMGTRLYYTPQQRTWVGLTWNDVPDEWVGKVAFMEGAKWADKQLKQKNGYAEEKNT